jgi:glucose-6-phosphate 1-dehydrogenase
MAADGVDALVIFGATGRLIGAALDGDRWLFAEQDTVEAAWRVVDPVLGDVTPVHPYAKGTWGPQGGRPPPPPPRRLARPRLTTSIIRKTFQ